jgi:hypothetical protein
MSFAHMHTRLGRTLAAIGLLIPLIGCGGGSKSPQAPTRVQQPPPPPPWNLPGHVVATLSGRPVAHATVNAFIATAESGTDGSFTLNTTPAPTSSQAVTVTAEGYRPRETVIQWPRTGDLLIDLMSTAAPFDETFFNQLARDALENPSKNYQLYRWSSQMKFYLKTQDEFGRPLDSGELESIRRGIRLGVQYYTAGTYEAIIEEGTETRSERVGWVNVLPRQEIPDGDFCGESSSVGANPSTIQIRIDRCGCGSIKIPTYFVIHEVGHAVGMFHVGGKGQIMNPVLDFNCRDVLPTAKEQYHAALIYARPRGNRSPDRDPGDFTLGYEGDLERPPARP